LSQYIDNEVLEMSEAGAAWRELVVKYEDLQTSNYTDRERQREGDEV